VQQVVARVDIGCSWRPNHVKSCVVYFSTVDSWLCVALRIYNLPNLVIKKLLSIFIVTKSSYTILVKKKSKKKELKCKKNVCERIECENFKW